MTTYTTLRDDPDFLIIRVFSRLFGMQNQYFSRYLTPKYENYLAEGLRVVDESGVRWDGGNHGGNYHGIYIHKDDAAELVSRVSAFRVTLGYEPVVWEPEKESH